MPKKKKTRQFGNRQYALRSTHDTKRRAEEIAHVQRTKRNNPVNARVVEEDGKFCVYIRAKPRGSMIPAGKKTRRFGNRTYYRRSAHKTRSRAEEIAHVQRTKRHDPMLTKVIEEDGKFVVYIRRK